MKERSPTDALVLLRKFYDVFGMPNEGPPPLFDVSPVAGALASLGDAEIEPLRRALHDNKLLQQFSSCRELLDDLANRLTTNELLRELSGLERPSEQEFDQLMSGILWFSLAGSLDKRASGALVTPLDDKLNLPLPLKVQLVVHGSLVLRLYVALVYMREGCLAKLIGQGAKARLPCCGRVQRLLNLDFIRHIRNALSHGSFRTTIAGIEFHDATATVMVTPGFLEWMCTWLMLIQLQTLTAWSGAGVAV